MAAYELEGTIKLIDELKTFNSGFTKREFVVTAEEDSKYPQDIKFECIKDKTALLDGLNKGQRVKVTFDIRGNEYNGRYYVNLSAWKVDPSSASEAPPMPEPPFEDSFPDEEILDGDPPF